jgi:hypothetical protein
MLLDSFTENHLSEFKTTSDGTQMRPLINFTSDKPFEYMFAVLNTVKSFQ